MNLNQITIPSLNLAQSVPFYQKLGLRLIVDAQPHYARFECPDGEATFSIHQVEQLPRDGGIWVYFECEHLNEYVQELVAKGVKFDEMPTEKSWLWREAKLTDPDQNQLILFYAGTNRKNPPWRIIHNL